MKMYLKFILIAVVSGFILSVNLTATDLTQLILYLGLGSFGLGAGYIVDIVFLFFPIFIFQMIFGTYIYRHFCSVSIYYFTRIDKRIHWFLKECSVLAIFAFVYQVALTLSAIISLSIINNLTYTKESIILTIYYIGIYSMYLYFTTLLVNLISIKFNSSIGFLSVMLFQVFLMSIYIYWGQIYDLGSLIVDENYNEIQRIGKIVVLNPLSNLVLKWNSSFIESVNQQINEFNISFDLNVSLLIFFVFSIISVLAGCFIIKSKDFIITNSETN